MIRELKRLGRLPGEKFVDNLAGELVGAEDGHQRRLVTMRQTAAAAGATGRGADQQWLLNYYIHMNVDTDTTNSKKQLHRSSMNSACLLKTKQTFIKFETHQKATVFATTPFIHSPVTKMGIRYAPPFPCRPWRQMAYNTGTSEKFVDNSINRG